MKARIILAKEGFQTKIFDVPTTSNGAVLRLLR